jgi:hypothetical protein
MLPSVISSCTTLPMSMTFSPKFLLLALGLAFPIPRVLADERTGFITWAPFCLLICPYNWRWGCAQAVKKFLAEAASRDVTFYEVDSGEHELLMGPKWRDLTDRIASWIKTHGSPS